MLFALDSEDADIAGQPLFELAIQSEIEATKIWVESGESCDWRVMIKLQIVSDSIKVEVLSSEIGLVKTDALQSSIRWWAGSIAQTWISPVTERHSRQHLLRIVD